MACEGSGLGSDLGYFASSPAYFLSCRVKSFQDCLDLQLEAGSHVGPRGWTLLSIGMPNQDYAGRSRSTALRLSPISRVIDRD